MISWNENAGMEMLQGASLSSTTASFHSSSHIFCHWYMWPYMHPTWCAMCAQPSGRVLWFSRASATAPA